MLMEDVVSKPMVKPFSKNDLEMEWNDAKFSALPPDVQVKIQQAPIGTKLISRYGRYIRDHHRKIFNAHHQHRCLKQREEGIENNEVV
jgi:hypothetical protein